MYSYNFKTFDRPVFQKLIGKFQIFYMDTYDRLKKKLNYQGKQTDSYEI